MENGLSMAGDQIDVIRFDVPFFEAFDNHFSVTYAYEGIQYTQILKVDLAFCENFTNVRLEIFVVWNGGKVLYQKVCLAPASGHFAQGYIQAIQRCSGHQANNIPLFLMSDTAELINVIFQRD
jgi:hypothetical protein